MSSPIPDKDSHDVEHVQVAQVFPDLDFQEEDHGLGPIQAARNRPYSTAWAMFAVATILLASFENQASGMVLAIPEFRKDFGRPFGGDYVLFAEWQSAFAGGPVASAVLGNFFAGYAADRLGRRPVIAVGLILSFVAIGIEFAATTNAQFFGGKFMNGFLTGTLLTASVTYIGEVTPVALRGIATCLAALMFTIGPLVSAIIIDRTGYFTSRWAYRSVFCAQWGFAFCCTVFVPFMPESPTWLMSVGKKNKAVSSLRRLGYKDNELEARCAQIEIILDGSKKETAGATYLDCFRTSNLRRTIISVMPLSIQALSGVFFIASYGTYYIQLAGFSTEDSFKLQIAQHASSMAGNIISWFLIDRVGRRALTLWGTLSITAILMIMAGLATANTTTTIKASVGMIIVYNFFYNLTIGATAYTLLCEVATSRLRVKTISIGIALQNILFCLWAFVIPFLFNPDQANLGAKTAFIFGGIGILCTIYLWLFQPETANRSFEELDELFLRGVKARDFKTFKLETTLGGEECRDAN